MNKDLNLFSTANIALHPFFWKILFYNNKFYLNKWVWHPDNYNHSLHQVSCPHIWTMVYYLFSDAKKPDILVLLMLILNQNWYNIHSEYPNIV